MLALLLSLALEVGAPLPVEADATAPPPDSSAASQQRAPTRRLVITPLVPAGESHRLVDPAGLAIDAFGRLYVSDATLHRLQRFDRDGSWLGESGNLGSEAGEMRVPGSVVRLGTLSIAVLDRENRRVVAFDLFGRRTGIVLDLTDPALEGQIGRVDPGVMAADRGGALYLTDPTRERILYFDASGRYRRSLGGYGSRPGQLRGVRGMALTTRGEVVVAERLNARLQILDNNGRPVRSWPLPVGRSPGDLAVAVDDGGRVVVADEANGRLWLFDPAGQPIAMADSLGRPRALAFAPDGRLIVAVRDPAGVHVLALEPPPAPAVPEGR